MSQILSNTGTNYTNYYNLIYFLADFMVQHPSLAGVSNEDLSDFDKREFPTYPIANIIVEDVRIGETTTDFNIKIIVADKYKNKNNESTGIHNEQTIPFFNTDDLVDVWANTLAIANDITSYIQRGVTNFDVGTINCEQYHESFDSGLAGWTVSFIATTHNDKNRCLFELYPQ
jgi:hypothetical protein